MNVFTRMAFFSVCLVLLFDGCSLQDHQPSLQNPSCQVLKLTIDQKTSGPDGYNPFETAVLDGKSVKIGKTASNVYIFDEQNRLIKYNWYTLGHGGNGGQEIFVYTADQIIDTSTHLGFDKQVHTIPLNKQGLLGWDGLKYNEQGFLVEKVEEYSTTTYTIENGNLVREERKSTFPNSPVMVSLYEYDLTKPNLPNSLPYRGKTSRNLPIKVTQSDGTITSSYSYTYIFDESGRQTRRYEKLPNGQYLVFDYTITCR